jgi:hypothetical protein
VASSSEVPLIPFMTIWSRPAGHNHDWIPQHHQGSVVAGGAPQSSGSHQPSQNCVMVQFLGLKHAAIYHDFHWYWCNWCNIAGLLKNQQK